ncbi:hypothetical protein V491_03112 [Pseudogymnoascus sp. VKM F-3775]|nr:hypothetical protein V491_03112 [Pseudogymnoascus sp. VKM F-3775]
MVLSLTSSRRNSMPVLQHTSPPSSSLQHGDCFFKILLRLRQKAVLRGPGASPRLIQTQATAQRRKLLQSIYQPAFAHLEPGSPEYEALADSGKVWEDYFKPSDMAPWREMQTKLQSTLDSVDKFKPFFKNRPTLRSSVTRSLISDYAHQSTSIEGNPLLPSDSFIIAEGLERELFSRIDFGRVSTQSLSELDLPSATDLLPSKEASQVAELRNHIVVSRYIADAALSNPGTPGVSLSVVKLLAGMMLRGTESERAAKYAWGPRVPLGEFRSAPISVRSNPLRVFPYHREVPACMKRFFEWRDETHVAGQLHPLIFATKMCVYFAHIYPFADGNGRMSRVLMADYLVRQGYLPVVFQSLDRQDYLTMISEAQDSEPEGLCTYVAQTALDMMFTISLR